jgi:hypothetical protein
MKKHISRLWRKIRFRTNIEVLSGTLVISPSSMSTPLVFSCKLSNEKWSINLVQSAMKMSKGELSWFFLYSQ